MEEEMTMIFIGPLAKATASLSVIALIAACQNDSGKNNDAYTLSVLGCTWRIGSEFVESPPSKLSRSWMDNLSLVRESRSISYTFKNPEPPNDSWSQRKEYGHHSFKFAHYGELTISQYDSPVGTIFEIMGNGRLALLNFTFEEFNDFVSPCVDVEQLVWEPLSESEAP